MSRLTFMLIDCFPCVYPLCLLGANAILNRSIVQSLRVRHYSLFFVTELVGCWCLLFILSLVHCNLLLLSTLMHAHVRLNYCSNQLFTSSLALCHAQHRSPTAGVVMPQMATFCSSWWVSAAKQPHKRAPVHKPTCSPLFCFQTSYYSFALSASLRLTYPCISCRVIFAHVLGLPGKRNHPLSTVPLSMPVKSAVPGTVLRYPSFWCLLHSVDCVCSILYAVYTFPTVSLLFIARYKYGAYIQMWRHIPEMNFTWFHLLRLILASFSFAFG